MNDFAHIACWVFASLIAGLGAGYYLGRSSPARKRPASVPPEQQTTLTVLEELLETAQQMSSDVESHNIQITKTAHDVGHLHVQGEWESVKQMLLGHMTGMLASNKQLQDDLTYTQYRVEEQAQVIDEVRREARTDGLTGVVNRLGFDEKMRFLMATWQRQQRPLTLVMLDLDHFKRINDAHGHQAGDRVLEEVGAWLRQWLRPGDVVARFGGDEFAVLLPNTELAEGMELAEMLRIRTGEGAHRVEVREGMVSVSFSIGVAAAEIGDTVETLLARADRALYQAKQGGRNRVCGQTAPETAPNHGSAGSQGLIGPGAPHGQPDSLQPSMAGNSADTPASV